MCVDAGGDAAAQPAARPASGGRLRRRVAAAGAGDEQMGETDAAPMDGDLVFGGMDDDLQDEEVRGG